MPPKLSKADEDRFELVRLRYHVEESEKRLAEQAKTIQHLRDLHSHKSSEYENLQVDADRLAGDYQRNLEYMEEELTTKEEHLTHEVSMLRLELMRVVNELDCCRTFERENQQLKQSVRELREELDTKEIAHVDELFRQKKEAFKQQSTMEQELQRMVSEMGDKYRKEAFEALSDESKRAITEQGQMQLKFLKQDETVQGLNERMVKLDQDNNQLRIDLEVVSDNLALQTVRTQKQKRELQEALDKKFELERDVRVLKMECQNTKRESTAHEDLQAEVARLTKALAKSERKASKWKARAMDVAKLAAANPHGQPIGGQPLAMHGTFGLKETSTPIKLDLENDDDQDPEWEEQEAEQDLRSIWHAAFTPPKPPREVVTAPTGKSRKGNHGVSGPGVKGARALQKRSTTALGALRGNMKRSGFANFNGRQI